MVTMLKVRKKSECDAMGEQLADLLFDPSAASAGVRAHAEGCDRCRREVEELRATMGLLDAWKAPEPSPYFLTRMEARQREAREAEPASWFAVLRDRFVYGTGTHVRPLAALALTVLLFVGGGAYLGVTDWERPPAAPVQTAVVHDLQTMDSNAQLLDQLEALSSNGQEGN